MTQHSGDPPEPVPAETSGIPEKEELLALRRERDELVLERDRIQGELTAVRRRQAIQELAGKHGFSDPDYLDFLLTREKIAPEDDGVAGFMTGLQERSPKLFRIALHPGAPKPAPRTPAASERTDRNAELIRQLESAPDFSR